MDFSNLVIYEDNHLLVVNKPVGIATMGVAQGKDSLFIRAKKYVKEKYHKPGEVYLGVVSRLDLPVSGTIVFARTSKAAKRLNEQFLSHNVQKIYLALVEGRLLQQEGSLTDFICENKRSGQLWVSRRQTNDSEYCTSKKAQLEYKVLARYAQSSLVEVRPLTGRKHQIRLQFSSKGNPIIGDGKYGAHPISQRGICLHAYKLILTHPTKNVLMEFVSSKPDWSRWER